MKRCTLRWKKVANATSYSPDRWRSEGRYLGKKVNFTIERYGRGMYSVMMGGHAPVTAHSLKRAKEMACGWTHSR